MSETAAVLLRKIYLDKPETLKRMDRDSAELIKAAAMRLFQGQKLSLLKRAAELLVKVEVYLTREKDLLALIQLNFKQVSSTSQKVALLYLMEITCEYALEEKALLENAAVL